MGPVPIVPHLHSSYAALRLPCVPRPRLRFPSPSAYLAAGAFFLAGIRVHPQNAKPLEICVRLSSTVTSLGDARASRVTGSSSSYVPETNTPPGPSATNPPHRLGPVFNHGEGLDTRGVKCHFGAESSGPHVRVPTHRPRCCCHRRKASLPTCRAVLWSGRFRTDWMTYWISRGHHHPHSSRPALPGRTPNDVERPIDWNATGAR